MTRHLASGARRGVLAAVVAVVAAIAAVLTVALGSGVGRSAAPTQELISSGAASGATDGAREPSISADGAVVVFTQLSASGVPTAWVRDRAAKPPTLTQVPLPERDASHRATRQLRAAVSADGCHVAFWSSVPPASGTAKFQLYEWDRCATPAAKPVAILPGDPSQPLDLPVADALLARPALSRDGRFVAYAAAAKSGDAWEIGRVDTSATPPAKVKLTSTPIMVLTTVDVSADGAVVVYDASGDAQNAHPTDVFAWSPDGGAPVARLSVAPNGDQATGTNAMPSISADGASVAFVSNSPQITGVGGGTTQLYVRDLHAGTTALVTGTPGSAQSGNVVEPDLNADGTQVAFAIGASPAVPDPAHPSVTETASVAVAHSVDHFATATVTTLSTDASGAPAPGTSSAPSVSATGRYVAYESSAGATLSGDSKFPDGFDVWAATRVPALAIAASTDLGSVTVGSSSTPTAVRVDNPSDVAVALGQVAAPGSGFAITADTCSNTVLPAGGSCTVTVAFTPTAPGQVSANLTVAGEDQRVSTVLSATGAEPRRELSADGGDVQFPSTAVGGRGGPVTVTIRNTGDLPVTVAGATLQGSAAAQFFVSANGCAGKQLAAGATCTVSVVALPSGPGTFQARLVVTGDQGESASANLKVVAYTSVVTTQAPPTTVRPGRLVADQTSVAFPPTPVGATSAPVTVTVTNAGGAAVSISTVAISGGGDQFAVDPGSCTSARLSAGRSCSVTVSVRPLQGGDLTASLSVRGSRGESVTVALLVQSTFAPSLTVVPGVAHRGDLVRVAGAGFPAARPVELRLGPATGSGPTMPLATVTADEAGTFTVGVVVPSNGIASGTWRIVVADQPDLAGTSAVLLVDQGVAAPGAATAPAGIGGIPRPGPQLP